MIGALLKGLMVRHRETPSMSESPRSKITALGDVSTVASTPLSAFKAYGHLITL